MDVNNAQLLRIDVPGTADAAGRIAYTQGAGIDIDAAAARVSSSQRFTLGARVADAEMVLYVDKDEVAGVKEGYRLLVSVAEEAEQLYEVMLRGVLANDVLGAVELFLKRV